MLYVLFVPVIPQPQVFYKCFNFIKTVINTVIISFLSVDDNRDDYLSRNMAIQEGDEVSERTVRDASVYEKIIETAQR